MTCYSHLWTAYLHSPTMNGSCVWASASPFPNPIRFNMKFLLDGFAPWLKRSHGTIMFSGSAVFDCVQGQTFHGDAMGWLQNTTQKPEAMIKQVTLEASQDYLKNHWEVHLKRHQEPFQSSNSTDLLLQFLNVAKLLPAAVSDSLLTCVLT